MGQTTDDYLTGVRAALTPQQWKLLKYEDPDAPGADNPVGAVVPPGK